MANSLLASPPPGPLFATVTTPVRITTMSVPATSPVRCVLFATFVARSVPFHFIFEAPTNPAPSTKRGNPGLPSTAEAGLNPSILGTGFRVTVVIALELSPCGSRSFRALPAAAWLLTVTLNVDPAAISLAGISALSWELLSNTVDLFCPFHRTTDVAMNPVPFTVRTNPGPPARIVLGLTLVMAGVPGPRVRIAKLLPCERLPPEPGAGLTTVTVAVPDVAISLAGIVALSSLVLTSSVGLAAPFQNTVAPETKLDP